MSLFIPESASSRTDALDSEFFPKFIFKISFIVIVIYVSALGIGSNKNGLLSRIKRFKRQVELVNKYPGLNLYPLLGSTPEMIHLVFQPCQGTV